MSSGPRIPFIDYVVSLSSKAEKELQANFVSHETMGAISREQLLALFRSMNITLTLAQFSVLVQEIDAENADSVEYSSFIATLRRLKCALRVIVFDSVLGPSVGGEVSTSPAAAGAASSPSPASLLTGTSPGQPGLGGGGGGGGGGGRAGSPLSSPVINFLTAGELSTIVKSRLKKVFDENGVKGRVSADGLRRALRSLDLPISSEQASALLGLMVTKSEGEVSLGEFTACMPGIKQAINLAQRFVATAASTPNRVRMSSFAGEVSGGESSSDNLWAIFQACGGTLGGQEKVPIQTLLVVLSQAGVTGADASSPEGRTADLTYFLSAVDSDGDGLFAYADLTRGMAALEARPGGTPAQQADFWTAKASLATSSQSTAKGKQDAGAGGAGEGGGGNKNNNNDDDQDNDNDDNDDDGSGSGSGHHHHHHSSHSHRHSREKDKLIKELQRDLKILQKDFDRVESKLSSKEHEIEELKERLRATEHELKQEKKTTRRMRKRAHDLVDDDDDDHDDEKASLLSGESGAGTSSGANGGKRRARTNDDSCCCCVIS